MNEISSNYHSDLINTFKGKQKDDKKTCETLANKLVYFMENFTKQFSDKLSSYQEEAQGKTQKLNKRTTAFTQGTTVLTAVLGGFASFLYGFGLKGAVPGKAVGSQSEKIFKFFDNHKKKAKNITLKTQEVSLNNINFDKCLTRIAIKIFMSYEEQFVHIFKEPEWFLSNMDSLIKDAIKKIINYIEKNNETIKQDNEDEDEGTIEEKFEEFIIKAFLNGESGAIVKEDHINKAQNLVRNKKWNWTRINKKTGIILLMNKNNQPNLVYYTLKDDQNDKPKFGFRLAFPCESENVNLFTECKEKGEYYNYLLDGEKLEEMVDLLLKIKSEKITGDSKDVHKDIIEIRKDLNKLVAFTKLEKSEITTPKLFLYNVTPPVAYFTGRLNELQEIFDKLTTNKSLGRISQAVSVCGMGGIGKTQLLKRFVQKNASEFSGNVIWINSESLDKLENAFKDLAEELNIELTKKDENGKIVELTMQNLVQEIYLKFSKCKVLFVFDNAHNFKSISDFLPTLHVDCVNKPFLLISSRTINWDIGQEGVIDLINLKTFHEAHEFVETNLIAELRDKGKIDELIKLLNHLPLALQQAVNYLNNKYKKYLLTGLNKYEIIDYISDYGKNCKEILNDENEDEEQRNLTTVFNTFNVTIESIKEDEEAMGALKIMAYLDPTRIDIEWLINNREKDNKKEWKAIELLYQNSMIHLHKGVATIHRLVQEVIRLQQTPREEIQVLNEIISMQNLPISHLISAWKFAYKHEEVVQKFVELNSPITESTYSELQELISGNCEEAVKKIINCFENSSNDNFLILKNVGFMHESLFLPAIKTRKFALVKFLHEKGFRTDLRALDSQDNFLHVAAMVEDNLNVVKYLAENLEGDLKSAVNKKRQLPAECAAFNGNIENVEYLTRNYDAKTRFKCKLFALLTSVRCENSLKKLEMYLKYLAKRQVLQEIINTKLCGQYPLEPAVINDYPNLVALLIENGADFNAKTFYYSSYLLLAAFAGSENGIKELIQKGADVNFADVSGFNALHHACTEGHLSVAMLLIEADISLAINDELGCTILHHMPYFVFSNLEIFKCLERIIDVKIKDVFGRTALFSAVRGKTTDFIEHLLNKLSSEELTRINVKDTDIFGHNLLHYATTMCDLTLFCMHDFRKFKFQYKRELMGRYCNYLHRNWTWHVKEVVETLLNAGVDPNDVDEQERTPLFFASYHALPSVIQLLVEATDEETVNDQDTSQRTPLHYACMNENYPLCEEILTSENIDHKSLFMIKSAAYGISLISAVKILLGFGADIQSKDKFGCQPIHYASMFGYINFVEFLIKNKADVSSENQEGNNALHLAALAGNIELLFRFVQSKNEHLIRLNRNGQTLIHLLVICNKDVNRYKAELEMRDDVIQWLVCDFNVDVNAKDKNGFAALDYAKLKQDEGLIGVIEKCIDKVRITEEPRSQETRDKQETKCELVDVM